MLAGYRIFYMRVVHFEIGFSLFDSYAVVNPFIAWRNFKLKGRPEGSANIENPVFGKHDWTLSKNGPNFAVVIIKKLYLIKTNGFDW